MQTIINVAQAFGLAGEIYDLTPYRVDAYEVATAVTIGGVAGRSSAGAVGAMDATTYTAFAGIFVRPHEAVNYGTVSAGSAYPLDPSLAQPAGATVQVLSMGRVVVNFSLTGSSEAAVTAATLADGTSMYVTSAGVLTTTSTNNTLIGKVVKGIKANASGVSGSGSNWTKTQPIVIELG